MSCNNAVFAELLDFLLSELAKNASLSTTRTYIQCLGGITYVLILSCEHLLLCNAMLAQYMLWPCVCPFVCVRVSVCPSVTSRCSTKTDRHRITQITPHNSLENLVF